MLIFSHMYLYVQGNCSIHLLRGFYQRISTYFKVFPLISVANWACHYQSFVFFVISFLILTTRVCLIFSDVARKTVSILLSYSCTSYIFNTSYETCLPIKHINQVVFSRSPHFFIFHTQYWLPWLVANICVSLFTSFTLLHKIKKNTHIIDILRKDWFWVQTYIVI